MALYYALIVAAVLVATAYLLITAGDVSQAQTSTPAAPTGLTVESFAHDSVTLSWDDPEDSSITGYQVLRRSLDGDEYGDGLGSTEFVAIAEDTGSSDTTYTDASVTARTRYAYQVKARNAQGPSEPSGPVDAETPKGPASPPGKEEQTGQTCPAPTPVEVAVTAVPIVVESTPAVYFVLYASHDVDDNTKVEYPVKVVLGNDGTTMLSENVAALPVDRYRVEKYSVADPADVDGDCTDDVTELNNLGAMSPVTPPPSSSATARWPFPIGRHSRHSHYLSG